MPDDAHLYSIEFNADNAAIARSILEHAGVHRRVTVVHGTLGDGGKTVDTLKTHHGFGPGALVAVSDCARALGRFLNHTPAEAMRSPTDAQEGLRRTWFQSCRYERLDPKAATRLPLLFALDAELGIADGFHYALDCRAALASGAGQTTYCATGMTGSGCSSCAGGGDGDSDGGCGGD